MSRSFRCSADSAALAEPLAGTASTVRAFLLVEVPGPWGIDALHDCRLPAEVAVELERRCDAAGVRPLLIRPHGRAPSHGIRCFGAYADPVEPRLESARLGHPDDLLGLDLEQLGRGEPMGLDADAGPLFLVCTHGRHDVCCAEQGRPVAAALNSLYPRQTWECSHIGGDRFAGNMLVLPDGLYYGRADRETGPRIAKAHEEGRLDLEHLRGRCGFGFADQAAEWHLRRRLDVTALDGLRLVRQGKRGAVTEAVFAVREHGRWRVQVRTARGEPCPLTCRVRRPQRPLRFELIGMESDVPTA